MAIKIDAKRANPPCHGAEVVPFVFQRNIACCKGLGALIGIPIVSGIAIVLGLFLVLLTVWTFLYELRKRWGRPQG